MNYFINNLPKFDYFNMNFHYSINNWLPFFWKNFKQTTRYTYIIDKDMTIKELSKNFETDIRRRRRKAEEFGVKVSESEDIKKFYELNKMTFKRQNRNIPYSFEFVEKLYTKCKENSACKILFAKDKNNIPIAGGFFVYDNNTVFYLMGGIDPNKKDLGGMDVVLYKGIKFALSTNRDFDFEGSMVESIEKYFRSFGAIQKQYFQISKTNSKLLKIKSCISGILK
jgi:lipid II:glycine glycyltransferase (peptidoglycan interpeptide bridge formation enzyme)